MKIVLMTCVFRGDVQPMIALTLSIRRQNSVATAVAALTPAERGGWSRR